MTLLSSLFPGINVRVPNTPIDHKWDSLFGVELEVESVRQAGGSFLDIPDGWTTHNDASLRNGVEFVLARPMGGDLLQTAISNFYSSYLTYTSGARTSTHIHVNMSDATVDELRAMIVMVYTIEDAIYACTEESRKWGGYSVALAEMSPARLRNILNAPSNHVFVSNVVPSRNNERYYGFNCNVSRHGTVEFRYFPGGPTLGELESWIDLVSLIRRASKKYTVEAINGIVNTPADLARFLHENFGEWAGRLLGARGPEEMMGNFDTVLAMALDEENPERSGGIVYITPALLHFTKVTILRNNNKAVEYLLNSIPASHIIGAGDWQHYLTQAKEIGYSTEDGSPPRWDSDDEDEEVEYSHSADIPEEFASPSGVVYQPSENLFSSRPGLEESYASYIARHRWETENHRSEAVAILRVLGGISSMSAYPPSDTTPR